MSVSRRIAGIVAGAVTFLLLCSPGPLSAQVQDDAVAHEQAILRPGINYLGWTSEDLDVATLRAQVPEIVSVRTWDPRTRRLYNPPRLTAGMGLIISVDAPAPVVWRRSPVPVSGLVRLAAGRNLVSWAGDEAPVSEAVVGVGDSLRRAWVPGGSRSLERGGALWVDVARPVNWLQPTGRLPGLHFPGGASAEFTREVRRDLRDVLEFSGTEFGVQADFAAANIYVASDVESYIEYRGLEGDEAEDARGTWSGAEAWASEGELVVLKQESWARGQDDEGDNAPTPYTHGRYVLAHEYFHLLQHQLGGGIEAPAWMVEGSATWFEGVLKQRDQRVPHAKVVAEPEFSTNLDDAPGLNGLEAGSGHGYEYDLGELALRLLVADSDLDAPLEFWRALQPIPVGPFGRWLPRSNWRSAFTDAFELTANSFYEDFQRWRQSAGLRSQRVRLLGPDGEALVGFEAFLLVTLRDETLRLPVGRETSGDGWATLPVNSDVVSYVVGADIGDCSVYAGQGSDVVYGEQAARRFVVGADAAEGLVIRLPEDVCTWRASGRVTDAAGDGLEGLRVDLRGSGVEVYADTRADGSFTVTAPKAGHYLLGVLWNDCWLYYGKRGPAALEQDATLLDLTGNDAFGVDLQFGDEYCSLRISGRIVDSRGNAMAADFVSARSGMLYSQAAVTDDGSFSLTVPQAGDYELIVGYEGCVVFYRAESVAPSFLQADPIEVSESSVEGVMVRFSNNTCAHRVSGTLVNFDGSPLASTGVLIRDSEGKHGDGLTDGQGRFSIRVPGNGAYRLSVYVDPCTAYWRRDGSVGRLEGAHVIRVSNGDVTGIEFRLPEDPAGLC